MGDFDNNEDMERTNAIINELFNNGIITEDEKKQLLITKESLKTATDYLTINKSLNGNEISNGLYNRSKDYLTAPLLSNEFTYCHIKSYDHKYLNYTDDGQIELKELPENNNNNFVFKIHIYSTNFVRFSNKDETAFLTVDTINKEHSISFPSIIEGEEIKNNNNLWILNKLDEVNKYIIESRSVINGKLHATADATDIIKTQSNHKNSIRWVLEPIHMQTNNQYDDVISPYFTELDDLILKDNKLHNINTIVTKSKRILTEIQGKLDDIKLDIENKQSESSLLFSYYNKDNEKYNNTKEELDNINKRNLIFEENFNLLHTKTKYDNFKNNTLYSIQFLLIIIVVGVFIINMKTIHKNMN